MAESRLLVDSISFPETADTWAQDRGLLDENGEVTTGYPAVIGVPDGSPNLGTFTLGIIQPNRTIKQGMQDLETAVSTRMLASNNLSDLPNKITARSNLGLGSASTWNVGTTGAVVPLLNTSNTWTSSQNFTSGVVISTEVDITNTINAVSRVNLKSNTLSRWSIIKTETAEAGSNAGADFAIFRYADDGSYINAPFVITRSTGVVSLGQPLPISSGGTGANSLSGLKTTLNLNNVDNTSDANKPISTATQTALDAKFDKTGGNISGNVTTQGSMTTGAYFRATNFLCVTGNSTEGGQLVLAYKGITGITGQVNSTWNVDVGSNNEFRIFRQRADGSTPGTDITIAESGGFALANGTLTVTNAGTVANFANITNQRGIVAVSNAYGSASLQALSSIDFRNENAFAVTRLNTYINVDGGSEVGISVTSSGARTSERLTEVFRLNAGAATFNVPISGRAFPRKADGTNINFNWNGQAGQPNWLWGGTDGVEMYVYNPSNFSVNNSAYLGGIGGGNQSGYIRRTNDVNGNGNWSRQLVLAGGAASDNVWSSPLEIREVNQVSNSNTTSPYAPGILLHWNQVASAAIKLHGDSTIRFQATADSVSYVPIFASEYYTTGWVRPTGATGIHWDAYGRGLTVSDNAANYGNVNIYGNGKGGWLGYSIHTHGTFMTNAADQVGIHSQVQNRWLVVWDNGGNATFPANITAYSDERLKRNLRAIDNVKERLEGMAKAAILYEREGITRIGFGAQTLEESNPEVVFTADDYVGTKSVNYGDLVAVLAVGNKLLNDRVSELETERDNLKQTVEEILTRLEKAGL